MENFDLSNLCVTDTANQDNQAAIKSFPSDVRKWMKANATPKMALKLMQLCKYFQHQQFPYFVVEDLNVWGDFFTFSDLNDIVDKWDTIKHVPNCLWITNEITVGYQGTINFLPQIISKIAVNETKWLVFSAERISFNDFKALTSSGTVKYLICEQTFIGDESDKIAPFEDILDCLPNIEKTCFQRFAPSFSTKEAAKKTFLLPNLKIIDLQEVENDFNVETFIEFMKKHKLVKFNFRIIGALEYAKQLQPYCCG